MSIIKVKKLWENGEIVALCNADYALNCDALNIGSMKPAWIVRKQGCCGSGEQTSLTFKDPNDVTALAGIWVESGGNGILLDAATVAAVADACNECCDDANGNVVAPVYDGVIPAIPDVASNTYCITRSDDGSYLAVQNAFLDYHGNYQTMVHKSNAAGVSKYEVKASVPPVAVGADVVAVGACV